MIKSVIVIGEPEIKRKLYEKLLHDKTNFAILIHSDIHIPQTTSIGQGTIIRMASAVYKDIPSDVIAMGNSARVMKKNENKRVFF